tara:strand:+ start:269 stop:421 length:153 start_codon:yes stop_codon:yes gene_type:complete
MVQPLKIKFQYLVHFQLLNHLEYYLLFELYKWNNPEKKIVIEKSSTKKTI